jgi:RNA polymerase sigma factor (sigma-70 family)
MGKSDDDLTVIQSVLQGRQSDYAILVSRYQQYVYTLVLRYVQQRELAEELAQDVFVKAYANLASFRGESKFSTWLYTIVHTTCLSHLRKINNTPVLLEEEKMINLLDAQQQETPWTRIEQNSRKATLNQAIGQLPETDGQVLTLFYMASQSVEEISNITGMTTTNVKVRLFRARQKLKEIIDSKYKHNLTD